MGFIQENNIELNLNLKRKYKLIHFSDVHVITHTNTDTKEDITKAINNENAWIRVRQDFASYFSEVCNSEHLIASTKCLDNLIDYTNLNNPDLLILTGDIIDYYSVSNYNYLKNSLNKVKCPYLFSCGNHETPSSLYKEITNNNNEINYIEFDEFIVVSIDDSKKVVNQYQFETLKKICLLNKPVIITCHIPMMSKHNELDMQKYDKYYIMGYDSNDQTTVSFIDFVVNNENIKAVFCGHTHGASISYLNKNKPQYCASSGLIGFVNNITIK